MTIEEIQPQFGVNYDVGYIGFTYAGDVIAREIAYFERWNRIGQISVSHAFVVTGPDALVEAHIEHGVQAATVSKYWNDARAKVYFRKPLGWTRELGQVIANNAIAKTGAPYGTLLLFEDAAKDTYVGHWLNGLLGGWPDRLIRKCLPQPKVLICSELAAYALGQLPAFKGRGVLGDALDEIDPQMLFEDSVIFEPWVGVCKKTDLTGSNPHIP